MGAILTRLVRNGACRATVCIHRENPYLHPPRPGAQHGLAAYWNARSATARAVGGTNFPAGARNLHVVRVVAGLAVRVLMRAIRDEAIDAGTRRRSMRCGRYGRGGSAKACVVGEVSRTWLSGSRSPALVRLFIAPVVARTPFPDFSLSLRAAGVDLLRPSLSGGERMPASG